MIIQELTTHNLICTYSDKGMKIKQVETDILYEIAYDITPGRYTYEETDIPRDELE